MSAQVRVVMNQDLETITHKVKLIPAKLSDYPMIQNMARFYAYEMSRYCGHDSKDWACPDDGLYECIDFKFYFVEENHYPYFIKVDDELAGFVLIDKKGTTSDVDWNMGQFYVHARFQGRGIAWEVLKQVWNQYKGIWEVRVMPENTKALNFWRRVINQFTSGNYTEEIKLVNNDSEKAERYAFKFTT